ncbi:MAG: serine protease [Candidatus Pacebacteria bacterium]|nr:serine protease [Candidatus Paceibacterota bacterium]
MEFLKFEEQVFLVTVLIKNLTDGELGTGFLMTKPVPDDLTRTKYLLFSNKHVFWGQKDKNNPSAKKRIVITFHQMEADGSSKLEALQNFIIDMDRTKPGYYDHPDPAVDVACANISSALNEGIPLHIKTVNFKNFFDFDKNTLTAGTDILFVGYPTGFYDYKNSLPVMRMGSIASIPSIDFNGLRQILLDAQIFPGSSGSPVFVPINGKYKLLGIVSDGIQKNLDFAEIEKISQKKCKKVLMPTEWIGLGLLFTNETIKEVYDLA